MVTLNQYMLHITRFYGAFFMSISWYECEIITQIHHFGCRRLSVAMIYGQGKIAESQGRVREFHFPDPVGTLLVEYQCINQVLTIWLCDMLSMNI